MHPANSLASCPSSKPKPRPPKPPSHRAKSSLKAESLTNMFDSVPVELQVHILRHLRPVVRRTHVWNREMLLLGYYEELAAFAGLRLVSRDWDQVVKPLAYEEVAFYLLLFDHAAWRINRVFMDGAPYIRSLVIFNQYVLPSTVIDAIGQGLRLCSNLSNLECYGDMSMIYTYSRWAIEVAPNLSSTLNSLIVEPNEDSVALSDSLLHLGPNLEKLEIAGWVEGTPRAFPLPAEMPNLTHLAIRHGTPSLSGLRQLISRITKRHGRGADGTGAYTSPLRSLSLLSVFGVQPPDILDILTVNDICSHLTCLRVRLAAAQDSSLAVQVAQLCPMLVEFSFTSPAASEVLNVLPPHLEFLELVYYPTRLMANLLQSIDQFVRCIKSGRVPKLRMLSVFRGDVFGGQFRHQDPALRAVCDEAGIHLVH